MLTMMRRNDTAGSKTYEIDQEISNAGAYQLRKNGDQLLFSDKAEYPLVTKKFKIFIETLQLVGGGGGGSNGLSFGASDNWRQGGGGGGYSSSGIDVSDSWSVAGGGGGSGLGFNNGTAGGSHPRYGTYGGAGQGGSGPGGGGGGGAGGENNDWSSRPGGGGGAGYAKIKCKVTLNGGGN
jgi:hypothetical protein